MDDSWQFSGACDEPGRIKGHCVGHRITVEAPPELVWHLVSDVVGWSRWNPLYPKAAGAPEVGATLRYTVMLADSRPKKVTAQVTRVTENELLEYGYASMAGFVRSLRYVEVEELSPVRCRVVNGAILGGPLGQLFSRKLGDRVGLGLQTINEALKIAAERKWHRRPG